MAAAYKCTKITNKGVSLITTDAFSVRVDYVNPVTSPPTPGSINLEIPTASMLEITDFQEAVDDALLLFGSNTMNWSL
jgi:hypothetical protein